MNESTAFRNSSELNSCSCEDNPSLSELKLYAAMAMQGLLSRPINDGPDWNPDQLAAFAYDCARALETRMLSSLS